MTLRREPRRDDDPCARKASSASRARRTPSALPSKSARRCRPPTRTAPRLRRRRGGSRSPATPQPWPAARQRFCTAAATVLASASVQGIPSRQHARRRNVSLRAERPRDPMAHRRERPGADMHSPRPAGASSSLGSRCTTCSAAIPRRLGVLRIELELQAGPSARVGCGPHRRGNSEGDAWDHDALLLGGLEPRVAKGLRTQAAGVQPEHARRDRRGHRLMTN
jgi:hypothetical protein